jgi:hypothetical protein
MLRQIPTPMRHGGWAQPAGGLMLVHLARPSDSDTIGSCIPECDIDGVLEVSESGAKMHWLTPGGNLLVMPAHTCRA